MNKLTIVFLAAIAVSSMPLTIASQSPAGLPNFAQVAPGLYRGAAPDAEGLQKLKSMRVETIIDLRISPKMVAKERAQVGQLGMQFLNLPMGDQPPTPKQVSAFMAAANAAAVHPVFIHCQHGADRTGCMFGIYRVVHDRWTYDRAYAEMRHYGFKPWYTKLSDAVRQRSSR